MFFWFICILPLETSGTASCGSMLYSIYQISNRHQMATLKPVDVIFGCENKRNMNNGSPRCWQKLPAEWSFQDSTPRTRVTVEASRTEDSLLISARQQKWRCNFETAFQNEEQESYQSKKNRIARLFDDSGILCSDIEGIYVKLSSPTLFLHQISSSRSQISSLALSKWHTLDPITV